MSAKKKDWNDYADDFFDDVEEKGKRKAKSSAKRTVKKMHTATKVIAVLALVVGIALGAVICTVLFKNDRFVLKGRTEISLDAGKAFVYAEEGVEAVCFGMDVSGDLTVQLNQTEDGLTLGSIADAKGGIAYEGAAGEPLFKVMVLLLDIRTAP